MSAESRETIDVALTGAAGQICYSLLPEILKGDGFGDRTVNLRLIEIPDAMGCLEGVAMELEDIASPYLGELNVFDNPEAGFNGINFAFLIGAFGRQKGEDRSSLLSKNGPIFERQGQALNLKAADDVRVLVVGNPANTNALVTAAWAPEIPVERFTAMTRLDHNRTVGRLAVLLDASTDQIEKVAIWGNHSDTMVLDLSNATVNGQPLPATFGPESSWYANFNEIISKRGARVIAARGASSGLSAARAAADHARDWMNGTNGGWISMGVYSHGEYSVPEGLVSSFPVTTAPGEFTIVEGLKLPVTTKERIAASVAELAQEKAALQELDLLPKAN